MCVCVCVCVCVYVRWTIQLYSSSTKNRWTVCGSSLRDESLYDGRNVSKMDQNRLVTKRGRHRVNFNPLTNDVIHECFWSISIRCNRQDVSDKMCSMMCTRCDDVFDKMYPHMMMYLHMMCSIRYIRVWCICIWCIRWCVLDKMYPHVMMYSIRYIHICCICIWCIR